MPRNRKKTRHILHQHFHKRLVERYGATTNRREMMKAIEQIQSGMSVPLGRISNRVSNHVVEMAVTEIASMEQTTIAVAVGYDSIRKALVTALPPAALETETENYIQTSPQS